jgi:hypothetical protein
VSAFNALQDQHHAKRHGNVLRPAVKRSFLQAGHNVLPSRFVPTSFGQMTQQLTHVAKRPEIHDLWNGERLG